MRCSRPLVLGAFVAVFGAQARAEASELPLELDWQAPPECYSAEMIRAELARIASVRPGRTPVKLSAHGRIERVGEQYRLVIQLTRDGHTFERRLASSECRALGREVTLLVALSFGEGVELLPEDASRGEAEPEPSKPEAPPPKPPAPAAPEATGAQEATHSAKSAGFRAGAFVGGGALFGAFPALAARAFAGADLGWHRAWLSPRIDLIAPVNDALERGVDTRYDGLGGGLSLCLGQPALESMFALCATGGATAVRGRSWGATESGSSVAAWYTGGPAVSVAWPERGSIGVRLEAALLISLNRPRFVVEGLGQAHQMSLLTPSLSLGVLLRP